MDPRGGLASLCNALLRATDAWGEMPRAFASDPASFLGAQGLLLRGGAAERAVNNWNTVIGIQSQRLAMLLGADGPISIHRPSLVQHVATESSWAPRCISP